MYGNSLCFSNWSKQKQQIHSVTVGGAYESRNTAVKKKKTKLSVENFFTQMLQVISQTITRKPEVNIELNKKF